MRAIITLIMEAASTSETSANFYQTAWRYNPEDIHLLNLSFVSSKHNSSSSLLTVLENPSFVKGP
jgi:hypothetical protein